MIIKGNIRTDGKALGNYLLSEGRYEKNREKNEHIEIWEANGIEQGDTLQNILADFQHSAAGSQCQKPLFHAYFRTDDGEVLTREQWFESVNRLEQRLELTGHERVIVTHRLNGQDHVHVAWNRMPTEQGNAAELRYYKHKCTDVARELEKEFGLRQLSNDRKKGKLSHDEERQALRHGKSPQEIKEELRICWQVADNGQSFAAALDEFGYLLAKGDKRDFVIVGQEGEIYSVARVTGSRVAAVRDRLADLNRESLPDVEKARAIQLDRATTRDTLKWEDDLAKAAIEKAEREEREQRQREAKDKESNRERFLAEQKQQAEMVQGYRQHQEAVKQQREAARLDAAQHKPEARAERTTLKKQARNIDRDIDKGLTKVAPRLFRGATKALEGVLDILVGAPPQTPEQRRAKAAEHAEREREAPQEAKAKTAEELRRRLLESIAAEAEKIKENERGREFGRGRKRGR